MIEFLFAILIAILLFAMPLAKRKSLKLLEKALFARFLFAMALAKRKLLKLQGVFFSPYRPPEGGHSIWRIEIAKQK